jgi:hypothetical protein
MMPECISETPGYVHHGVEPDIDWFHFQGLGGCNGEEVLVQIRDVESHCAWVACDVEDNVVCMGDVREVDAARGLVGCCEALGGNYVNMSFAAGNNPCSNPTDVWVSVEPNPNFIECVAYDVDLDVSPL